MKEKQKRKGHDSPHLSKVLRRLSYVLMGCTLMILSGQTALAKTPGTEKQALTYFKDQLSAGSMEEVLYKGMEALYTDGSLQTGKGSIDITKDLPDGVLEGYVKNGETTLPRAFQAARDAFVQDYPDLFYLDSTKLTLRVGQKGTDQYIAFINNGSNADYYQSRYTSSTQVAEDFAAAKEVKDAIIRTAKTNSSVKDQIIAVHNELVNKITYTYPSDTNRNVAGIYGALVEGMANCEGYSRSFKWIMDELDIPCVLVQGSATNSNDITEAHMWNMVKIEDKWFAVDVTWDDPIQAAKDTEIRTKYLLAGSDTLDENHFPSGVLSNGSKDFSYPTLCSMDYNVYITSSTEDVEKDLKITNERSVEDGEVVTLYSIYYKGKTLKEIEKAGMHLAGRFSYKKDNGKFQPWVDLSVYNVVDGISPMKLPIGKAGTIQFCITKEKMTGTSYAKDLSLEGNHEANSLTKTMQIPYFNEYVSPPFIRKSTPELTSRVLPETQHYRVEYDQQLVRVDESKEPGISVSTTQNHLKYAVTNVTVSDEETTLWDGTKRMATFVEFDFIPDVSFQGYVNTYNLQPTNLVGKTSQKAPNSIPIVTTFVQSIPCPIFASQGGDNNAFVLAFPSLVANSNMDIFETAEGHKASGMDIRLIATIPNTAKEGELLDALDNDQILSSASYDLSLGCKNVSARLAQADYHLTIGVPYPDGYNYNDNPNITFKAYHYVKQDDGTYKVEELACRITERGLEVIAESFSPFTIVALPKEPEKSNYKLVSITTESQNGVVKTTLGGNEVVAEGLYKLDASNNSQDFSIQADEGYEIDKLYINGIEQPEVSGETEYNTTFTYASLKSRAIANANEIENTLKVSFIAKTVLEEEITAAYTPVTPEIVIQIPELTDISVSDTHVRKIYTEGEHFDKNGLVVTGIYNDGSTKRLEKYTVSTEPLSLETTSVSVSFSKDENGSVFTKEITGIKVNPKPTQKILVGISVLTPPAKVDYLGSEKFDPTGLAVIAEYLNGETAELDSADYQIDIAGKSLTPKDKQALFTYTENEITRTTKLNISVTNILTSLEITGTPKTAYFEGDRFSTEGITVTAVYHDNTTEAIAADKYRISPNVPLTTADKEVTISYTESGVTKTVPIAVTVAANTLDTLSITTPPAKTVYYSGEVFDRTGMTVTGTYANGTSKTLTEYTVTPEGILSADSVIQVQVGTLSINVDSIHIYELDADLILHSDSVKTEYEYGEVFNPEGLVVEASYNGGTYTEPISDYACTPSGALTNTDTSITLTYTKFGRTAAASIPITVSHDPLEVPVSVSLSGTLEKTDYLAGDVFSPAGLTATALYQDNGTEDVTNRVTYQTTPLALTDTEITVSYLGVAADSTIPISVTELSGIEVQTPPKADYYEGEALNIDGMEILASYIDKDGQITTRLVDTYTCSPEAGTALTVLNTNVLISFADGLQTHTVNQPVKVSKNTLKSITIDTPPVKTSYFEGDIFDPAGMTVTAHYLNGASETVDAFLFTPEGILNTSDTSITVSYTKDEITQEATQEITVEPVLLESITITASPSKTDYLEGETFDDTGMVVTAAYNNGATMEVTNYTYAPEGSLTAKDTKITVQYTETDITADAEQSITVTSISSILNQYDIQKPANLVYDGTSKEVTVTKNGAPATSDDFAIFDVVYKKGGSIVTSKDVKNAGTYTATITGKGIYNGEGKTITFTISGVSLANAKISGIKNATYSGKAITQAPSVSMDGKTLKRNTDYTLSYKANTNVGTATVTITGKGNYVKSVSKTFTIKQAAQKLSISSTVEKTLAKRYLNSTSYTLKPSGVKTAVTYKSSDSKIVAVSSKGTLSYKGAGKATITITAKGNQNYKAATKKITITVYPKKPATASISYLKSLKKGQVAITAGKVKEITGYQVKYTTDKKFVKSVKSTTVKTTGNLSKTLTNLSSRKTYYVKIRTFKKIGSYTTYGNYSSTKTVTVK